MITIPELIARCIGWGCSDFMLHTMAGLDMILLACDMIYDGRC